MPRFIPFSSSIQAELEDGVVYRTLLACPTEQGHQLQRDLIYAHKRYMQSLDMRPVGGVPTINRPGERQVARRVKLERQQLKGWPEAALYPLADEIHLWRLRDVQRRAENEIWRRARARRDAQRAWDAYYRAHVQPALDVHLIPDLAGIVLGYLLPETLALC